MLLPGPSCTFLPLAFPVMSSSENPRARSPTIINHDVCPLDSRAPLPIVEGF